MVFPFRVIDRIYGGCGRCSRLSADARGLKGRKRVALEEQDVLETALHVQFAKTQMVPKTRRFMESGDVLH